MGFPIRDGSGAVVGSNTTGIGNVNAPGVDATYRAVAAFTAAHSFAGPKPLLVWNLGASPTLLSQLKRVRLLLNTDGTNKTTAPITVSLVRYSTLATAGTTGTAPTVVPDDSLLGAPQTTFTVWTANDATAGTVVGTFAEGSVYVNAATGSGIGQSEYVFDFTRNTDSAPTLRLATEQFGIVLSGALPTTNTGVASVEFCEYDPTKV